MNPTLKISTTLPTWRWMLQRFSAKLMDIFWRVPVKFKKFETIFREKPIDSCRKNQELVKLKKLMSKASILMRPSRTQKIYCRCSRRWKVRNFLKRRMSSREEGKRARNWRVTNSLRYSGMRWFWKWIKLLSHKLLKFQKWQSADLLKSSNQTQILWTSYRRLGRRQKSWRRW